MAAARIAGTGSSGTWGSSLTCGEFAAVRSAGFEPVGQVFGAAVFAAGAASESRCPAAGGSAGGGGPGGAAGPGEREGGGGGGGGGGVFRAGGGAVAGGAQTPPPRGPRGVPPLGGARGGRRAVVAG